MRRRYVMAPLLLVSIAFFVAAGLAPSDQHAILLATAGALVPALGLVATALSNSLRWHRMGRRLGLVPRAGGMFPDLEGRYRGRRLVVSRRQNPYGLGPRQATRIKLEGTPEVQLPGLVADAGTVTGILDPLVDAG